MSRLILLRLGCSTKYCKRSIQMFKELWTGEADLPEVKTSYQYVLELREGLDITLKVAQEELAKSHQKNK